MILAEKSRQEANQELRAVAAVVHQCMGADWFMVEELSGKSIPELVRQALTDIRKQQRMVFNG